MSSLFGIPEFSSSGSTSEIDQNSLDRQREKLVAIHWLSSFIRIFTVIDGIFLLFWGIFYWPLLFVLLLVVGGYYGALHYRPELLALYGGYVTFEIGLRIYWLARGVDSRPFFIVVTVIGIVISFYILTLVIRLMILINRLNPLEIEILKTSSMLFLTDSPAFINSHPIFRSPPIVVVQPPSESWPVSSPHPPYVPYYQSFYGPYYFHPPTQSGIGNYQPPNRPQSSSTPGGISFSHPESGEQIRTSNNEKSRESPEKEGATYGGTIAERTEE